MRKTLTLALLTALALGAQAQLRSVGEVPADLKMTTGELYQADLRRAEQYTGGKVKDKKQIEEASYMVGKLMAGGRIVYGDPVSRLASRIADTLLKDHPALRSELRFYTVKSPEVNAFATGQGMVFINAGLVAQAENEAQLAFIISHEIIHYCNNHSMEDLLGGKDGKRKPDTDAERAEQNDFLRRHTRSREMENEADSLGIARFYLASPYDKRVTEGVFDVLQYSALPFDDIPFDTTWFNTPYYQLTGCWLDTVADITSRDNYDDSRSTHPNILTRRRNCAATLDGYYGGEQYVTVSREEFERIRHQARIECIRQELIYGEYSRAFYNIWLLLRQKPDDERLNELMAQSLYGIAMSKNHNGTNAVAGDYEKIEGESQQLYYAFRRMTNEQATLAALHRIWTMHSRFPDNALFTAMCDDLMEELRTSLKLSSTDFLSTPPTAAEATADTVQREEKAMTKYERIRQKRQSQAQRKPISYSLTDLMMGDQAFADALKSHLSGTVAKPADSTGGNMGAGILVYSPSYWVVHDKDDRLDVPASERHEQDLTARVTRMGKRFGRESTDFSDAGMRSMTTADQYNDFVTLNEWINEFWQTKGQYRMHRLTQPAMDDLTERYGANTLTVTAVLNTEGLQPMTTPAYLFLVPMAPYILYGSFANTERTSMVTLVIDAREGKVLSRQSCSCQVADHDALIDAMLYDSYSRACHGGKAPVGFMGNRFALAGGVALGLTGWQPLATGKIFSFTPWATAEYALSRRFGLVAGWRYQHGFDELAGQDLSKHMTVWNLSARAYSNTDFAPLGPYVNFGLHLVQFTNMSDGSNGGSTFGLHLGSGRNYVFFDRLLLNIEATYAYTVGLTEVFKLWSFDEEEVQGHKIDAILSNILLLKVGLGIIPF